MMLSTFYKASSRFASRSVARTSARGFAKEIKFGVEGRQAMLNGVNTLADAVQVSSCSSGRRV
jgi:chaperonin GroEL